MSSLAPEPRARKNLHRRAPCRDPRRIESLQSPQRLVPVHPVALVGIVAGAEIDAPHPVDFDDMAEQRRRQQGAGRGFQAVLDMRELVDEGGAVLDGPELRRDRNPLDPRDPHAKCPARAFGLGKGAQQRGIAFLGLPARGIDAFIGRPASGVEGGQQLDIDNTLPALAPDRVLERAGAAVPPPVVRHVAQVEPVAVARRSRFHPPAGAAQRGGDGGLFGVGDGIEGQARGFPPEPCEQRAERGGAVAFARVKRPDREAVPVGQAVEMTAPFAAQR